MTVTFTQPTKFGFPSFGGAPRDAFIGNRGRRGESGGKKREKSEGKML